MRTKGEARHLLRARRRELVAGRDLAADAEAIAAAVVGTALRGSEPLAPRGTALTTPFEARVWRPSHLRTAPFEARAWRPSHLRTALSYESLPHEPPTTALNSALQAVGHRVLVPITLPDMRLEWCDLADPDRTPLGVDAPRRADLAVVPALAVDTTGTRLGQGGGCYDRVLPMLPLDCPVVALLHPGEYTEEVLPRDPHDVPVTAVVTASGAEQPGL